MAGIVTETKRRLLIGKEIKEVQVPTNTLDTSLYLADLASVGATYNSSRIASELGALPAVVKQNASLALIADTYKTGAVYAMNGDTKSLEELNFERGSSATYEDASGNIVLASANVPRLNWSNGVLQGWLVEPASTNLLLDSGVDNGLGSFQIKSSVGLSAGPSGFNLGPLLANSVTIARHSSFNTYTHKRPNVALEEGKIYTFSFFCRLSDGSAPIPNDMEVVFGYGNNRFASWNSISYGNGVYRCYVTGVPKISESDVYFGIHKSISESDKSITVSGFQLEEGPLTSYIPTTTAIATRLADKISTKRPTVVFPKNSMYVKTAEWPSVWFGNGVDNLNIAGRNILKNSNSGAVYFNGYAGGVATKTNNTVAVPEWGATDANRVILSGGGSQFKALSQLYTPKIGEVVTLSVWIKNNGTENFAIGSNIGGFNGIGVGDSKRITFNGIVGNGSNALNLSIMANSASSIVDFTWWRIKVENGATETSWSPAPEDYVKVDSNGNIEISYTEPIHIQQFSLISRELSQEEVG